MPSCPFLKNTKIGYDLTSTTSSCLCQGECDGEYRCLHEKTVHFAINDLFPSGMNGGPVHVGEHFGQNLTPVFEYEDETWGDSCIRQSKGLRRLSFNIMLILQTLPRACSRLTIIEV